jgi:hypothetical protein
MKQRVAVLLAVAGFGVAAPVSTAAKPAPKASIASCTYGRIGGRIKCLRRGEYCARRYERQYERYGFRCSKLDYLGRWHLQ